MSESGNRPALTLYVAALALVAAVGLPLSWALYTPSFGIQFVLLLVLAVLFEWSPVQISPGMDVAGDYPFTIASVVLFGPTAGAILALVAIVVAQVRLRPGWLKAIFNVSEVVITALAGGWAYVLALSLGARALGMSPLLGNGLGTASGLFAVPTTVALGPILLASSVFVMAVVVSLVNYALVFMVLRLASGASISQSVGSGPRLVFLTDFALAILALAMAQIAVKTPYGVGLVLFSVPLLVARTTFRHYASLQTAYPRALGALVKVVEAKDEYTRGHSERVATLATEFALFVGLRPAHVEEVKNAALLHDLGKLATRHEVLSKPAKLTDAEYAEMKEHPARGVPIVAGIPGTAKYLPVIRHHHERIDGNGYPDGLSGDEIPFEARLLAICDSYDAMTSSRPYRAGMSVPEAVAELERVAGTQLDQELTAQFVSMLAGDEDD